MKVALIIEEKDLKTKTCPFCGREFDYEELCKTLKEQKWGGSRTPNWGSHKYCGLFCSWLNDLDMISTLRRMGKEEKIERMKEDIASRVAKYLTKNRRKGK